MKLNGGIDTYSLKGIRYKSDQKPTGRKVRFLNCGGYDSEREYANSIFKEGEVLTIKEIYVGRSSSTVEFFEYVGQNFNTVMFEDIEDTPVSISKENFSRIYDLVVRIQEGKVEMLPEIRELNSLLDKIQEEK